MGYSFNRVSLLYENIFIQDYTKDNYILPIVLTHLKKASIPEYQKDGSRYWGLFDHFFTQPLA